MSRSGCPSGGRSRRRQNAGEVDDHCADLGAGEVAHGYLVGAAEGVHVDGLDAGGVHRDVADVAEQLEAVAVAREIDLLGGGGAVEDHRVATALPVDDVAAVARVPPEGVVAGAQHGRVGAAVAVDDIVAGPADEQLVAVTADELVVAGTAEESSPLRSLR